MSFRRGNAVINKACVLKMRFKISGVLYNPYEVRLVELYDVDPDSVPAPTLIATYTPVKDIDGVWEIEVPVNILDSMGVWFEKWYFTWESGETEVTKVQDFYVSAVEITTYYTTKANIVANLDNVSEGSIYDLWLEWADAYIDEICNRDFRKHEGKEQTDYVEDDTTELIILTENYPIIKINSITNDDIVININYYRFEDWGKIIFGSSGYGISFVEDDKIVTNYDYGYAIVPKLVEEVATMIAMNFYLSKKTKELMGNTLLVTKSKRFVNYAVTYELISSDFLKKDSELFQKVRLLKKQYAK